ncbi:hypothetical protein GBF38_017564 [Nibea albiflora]|uniref:Uncharacterized protein n=1 Tax=Nibea albiflora TaxID=240163 RepID=A0ACB7EJ84_NIBAL|nr:hypothetical protein GBF38_017564 [Nibea albiflora]
MASTQVLLLQLLLVSLASASHHYGGTVGFTYKGRNPDGTFQVDLRTTSSFRGCYHHYSSYCYTGNCGYVSRNQRGVVDRNNNASSYSTGQWCDTQTVETRNVPNDRLFQMRISSCCWVWTRNSLSSWNLLTFVDLGTRSDTGQPNRSPDVAILHVLRVPQNCPRTYRLMSFDPDGDKVRCRYGNIRSVECSTCHQPPGFYIDQGSCTLYYQSASSDSNRVFGFEMVVEDFPLENVILSYSDGSRSSRAPLSLVVVAGGYDHSSSTDHGHLMVVVVAEYNNGTNHNSTDHDRPMAVVVAEYNNGTNHNSTDHDHPMVVVAEYNNSTNHNSTDHNHPMVVVVA